MIGFDIDGVVYNWHQHIYDYLVMYKGLKDDYNLFWSKTHTQYGKKSWEYFASMEDIYYKYIPEKSLVEMMERINEKHGYIFITQRADSLRFVTERWLETFKFPNSNNVIFCSDKTVACRFYNLSAFVEDKITNAEALSKYTRVILVRQPWNEHACSKFENIKSIYEVEELL